jgi:hypothetical protein
MSQLVILHDSLAEIKCHKHGWHNIPAERWHFNGNLEKPTFSPSVRELESGEGSVTRCHYTVTEGRITYHEDNAHEFAGQTLDMIPFAEHELLREDWVTRQEES